MTPAALGFRAHSGWAALVVVAGTPRTPTIIERQKIQLVDPKVSGSKQPYHTAAEMELKEAEKFVKQCTDKARLLARQGMRVVLGEVRKRGYSVVASGLLLGSGRALPSLAATLASHPLIHTAEGELFRDALRRASEQGHLPVASVREREVYDRAAARFRMPVAELKRRLNELRRSLGSPWRQDEKRAALVGWLALAVPARG